MSRLTHCVVADIGYTCSCEKERVVICHAGKPGLKGTGMIGSTVIGSVDIGRWCIMVNRIGSFYIKNYANIPLLK